MTGGEIWVLKVPTVLDANMLSPLEVDGYDYTACREAESCYGGIYPEYFEIVNYYVPLA